MGVHSFFVFFTLPEFDEHFEVKLYSSGCDDALVGYGSRRYFAAFDRTAPSLPAAVSSALRDILRALPKANLREISFDKAF